jgi:hypothetical protein
MSEWADRDPADAAIDRAVREIMSAEPRPGFRQRVFARLSREPQRSALWSWPRLAIGAVGALAIILVIVMSRPVERNREAPRVAQTSPAVDARPPVAAPESPVRSKPATVPPAPRLRDRLRSRSEPRMVRAASLVPESIESGRSTDGVIEPPIAIEQLAWPPLYTSPLSAPQVIVKPLMPLERIAISPLTPPSPPK